MKHFYSTNNANPDEMPHISSGPLLFTEVHKSCRDFLCTQGLYKKHKHTHCIKSLQEPKI